jgi:hypothetical protein
MIGGGSGEGGVWAGLAPLRAADDPNAAMMAHDNGRRSQRGWSAMKRLDTCYTCRFWEGQGLRQRGPKGACHRYPPVVTPRSPEGDFPVTISTAWCGEWKRVVTQAGDGEPDSTIYDDLVG